MRKFVLTLCVLALPLFTPAPSLAQSPLDNLLNPRGGNSDREVYSESSRQYQHENDDQLRREHRRLTAIARALEDEMSRRGLRD
jgi:hypothetical protein